MDPGPQESFASAVFYDVEPFVLGEPEHCKLCNKPIRPSLRLPPLRYEIEVEGKCVGDILFGPGAGILVSAKFKNEFGSVGLKGISDFRITEIVHLKKGKRIFPPVSEFFQITILRTGRINIIESGLEEPPSCNACLRSQEFKRIRRVVLETNSWGDADIFIPFGTLTTVLTSRKFRDFCVEKEISNAIFIPAEEFSKEFFPWEENSIPQK
ncbi:MAG: hypothetical protein HQM10_11440 [Candidatus Riflebacteria bacterium]|nr:hypothetical protein [Candidatus Riflebacteria bacterium]